jgi:site-specific DNA recombinase
MIEFRYDPHEKAIVVEYGRMSDKDQNPLSPDQQFTSIDDVLKQKGYPWEVIKRFRDDGITGRRVLSRPGLRSMLQFVENPANKVRYILIDHEERFGRSKELKILKLRLLNRCGIIVLSAEHGFADPTTALGELQAHIDEMRATEGNRRKSEDVKRGKRHAVMLKRWPGGVPPLGYKLKHHVMDLPGRQPLIYATLVPNEDTIGILTKMFELADHTGEGYTRLARLLNADPTIPEMYKPLNRTTVGRILQNKIYVGIYEHQRHQRAIVADRNLCRKNPESAILKVDDFCEPLISLELFNKVNSDRVARTLKCTPKFRKQQSSNSGLARGLSVKYHLSGLIYCAHCQSSMHAECNQYPSANGISYYGAYKCPRTLAGGCDNRSYPKMKWLNQQITTILLDHLGLSEGHRDLQKNVHTMLQQVRQLLQGLREHSPKVDVKELQAQLSSLQKREDGWVKSLADGNLPAPARERLNKELSALYEQRACIEKQLQQQNAEIDSESFLQLDSKQIQRQLKLLPELLAASNATRTNVELALHIDKITVFKDGALKVRIFKLGFLGHQHGRLNELGSLLPNSNSSMFAPGDKVARPRQRTLRDIEDLTSPDDLLEKNLFSQDPHRFDHYPDDLFWNHTIQMEKKVPWCEQHAEEVYQEFQHTPNKSELARKYSVSGPTIARAIEVYEEKMNAEKSA